MKSDMNKSLINMGMLLASFLLIMYGIQNGEAQTVFNKAINICMECIGIG